MENANIENITMDMQPKIPEKEVNSMPIGNKWQPRRSVVWKCFTELENGCRQCRGCGMVFTSSNGGNLIRHMRRVHPDLLEIENSKETNRSECWKFFTKLGSVSARCNICGIEMSLKSRSMGNIRRHLRRVHPSVLKAIERVQRNGTAPSDTNAGARPPAVDSPQGVPARPSAQSEQAKSSAKKAAAARMATRLGLWKHFTDLGDGYAECNSCGAEVSWKSTTGNLRKHLRRVHRTFIENNHPETGTEENDTFPHQDQNQQPDKEDRASPIVHTFPKVTKLDSNGRNDESRDAFSGSDNPEFLLGEQITNTEEEESVPDQKIDEYQTSSNMLERYLNEDLIKTEKEKTEDECVPRQYPDQSIRMLAGSKTSYNSPNQSIRIIAGSETSCNGVRSRDLSERLVQAVEEGNRLLRSVHLVLEKQGETLNRLVECFEAMHESHKNDAS